MTSATESLQLRVQAQRSHNPTMYGSIDFSRVPERFTEQLSDASTLPKRLAGERPALLANRDRVALLRAYTMLGDPVADAYAALLPQLGGGRLITMLQTACASSTEHVPNAPPELQAFISEMEQTPAWLDGRLIERGARLQRNEYAHITPYAIRGAFFATFMNKYSALPMAITGALSSATAARRVKETQTFFSTSVLPGALGRHGEGFAAAAMVRLMHSMVRFNVLVRRSDWDASVNGVPIPQVDQMPAGLIGVFLLARRVLHEGRSWFTYDERAIVELSRYRCFLLGLPEQLLAVEPHAINELMLTRAATLRAGFDDATCGALMRATMAAELSEDTSLLGRLDTNLERGFSKIFFLRNFVDGDRRAAARMGVAVEGADFAWAAAAVAWIVSHVLAYRVAARVPLLRELADQRLIHKLRKQLTRHGRAEYTTHAERYRPPAPALA